MQYAVSKWKITQKSSEFCHSDVLTEWDQQIWSHPESQVTQFTSSKSVEGRIAAMKFLHGLQPSCIFRAVIWVPTNFEIIVSRRIFFGNVFNDRGPLHQSSPYAQLSIPSTFIQTTKTAWSNYPVSNGVENITVQPISGLYDLQRRFKVCFPPIFLPQPWSQQ